MTQYFSHAGMTLTILETDTFQSVENFEYRICDVNYNFVSRCRKKDEVN